MSERPQPPSRRRWPEGLRWVGCFVLVLGLHATAAAALMDHWRAKDEPVANGPVIMINLAPIEASPARPPNDVAPPPKPTASKSPPKPEPELKPEPKPEKAEKAEKPAKPDVTAKPDQPKPPEKPAEPEKPTVTADLKPQPEPPVDKIAPTPAPVPLPPPAETHTVLQDVAIPPPRPAEQIRKQKIREQKHRQQLAKLTPEPTQRRHRASRAMAPRAGAQAHDPNAVPRWKTALVMRLQHYKRYPAEAQERGVQGVAQLAFSVDRSGHVHHARIVRSSGSSLLDHATMQLIARAQPLPPPPPEVHGTEIAIVVPIRYNLR
jgi:periplasmic protein TonB